MALRNLEQYTIIEAKTDLASIKGIVTQTIFRNKNVLVNSDLGLFYWDSTSTATSNDVDVIKPDDITLPTPGRWIRYNQMIKLVDRFIGPKDENDFIQVWSTTGATIGYRLENSLNTWDIINNEVTGDLTIKDDHSGDKNRIKFKGTNLNVEIGEVGFYSDLYIKQGNLYIGNDTVAGTYEIFLENPDHQWSTKINSIDGDYIIRDITNSKNKFIIDATSGDITFGTDLDVFLPSGDLTIGNSSYTSIPHLYLERISHKRSCELTSNGTFRIWNNGSSIALLDISASGDFEVQPDIFFGWNAYYLLGFKVRTGTHSAGVLKHDDNDNAFEFYLSSNNVADSTLDKIFSIKRNGFTSPASFETFFGSVIQNSEIKFSIECGIGGHAEIHFGHQLNGQLLGIRQYIDHTYFYSDHGSPTTNDFLRFDLSAQRIARIRLKKITITTGTYNNLDVSDASVVNCDTSSGDITINGFSNGVTDQPLQILKSDPLNYLYINHEDVNGVQKIRNPLHATQTINNNDTCLGFLYYHSGYWYANKMT